MKQGPPNSRFLTLGSCDGLDFVTVPESTKLNKRPTQNELLIIRHSGKNIKRHEQVLRCIQKRLVSEKIFSLSAISVATVFKNFLAFNLVCVDFLSFYTFIQQQ